MEITANAIQTVGANNDIMFTDTAVSGCQSIIHREGSGLVTLRGLRRQCRARFHLKFGANIAIPTGTDVAPISLDVAINGEPFGTTKMISTPTAVDQYNNVSTSAFIEVPVGCCTSIAIKNTSSIPINVQNANLIVERVA